ncbi:hypothetical protein QVD17_04619 [Tagetes erecta]|uniref:Uncharacterized protein n=1 Tax=Tagetes erecta TaxID=13708 RepID=A0AAD8LD14_TARER|nr:hypothetical protein QVD17_04619 [Tagetes erecta]
MSSITISNETIHGIVRRVKHRPSSFLTETQLLFLLVSECPRSKGLMAAILLCQRELEWNWLSHPERRAEKLMSEGFSSVRDGCICRTFSGGSISAGCWNDASRAGSRFRKMKGPHSVGAIVRNSHRALSFTANPILLMPRLKRPSWTKIQRDQSCWGQPAQRALFVQLGGPESGLPDRECGLGSIASYFQRPF